MARTVPIGLEGILEHSIAPMLLVDDSRRVIEANGALCRLLGLPRSDILGKSLSDLTPADLHDDVEPTWKRFIGEGALSGSWRLLTGNGDAIDIGYSATVNVGPGRHLAIVNLESGDLTPRETEVLTCLAMGMTGRECADELRVSVDTVQKHVGAAKKKLGAHTRAHAVVLALESGMIGATGRH